MSHLSCTQMSLYTSVALRSGSDRSDDTDEFIRNIRTELEQQDDIFSPGSDHEGLLQLIQEEEPPKHIDSALTSPMKGSVQFSPLKYDLTLHRDIDKVLESLGHDNGRSPECYLTDEENELINVTREKNTGFNLSHTITTPMNSTPRHKITSQFQPGSLLTSEPDLATPSHTQTEVFMTPMQEFPCSTTEWSEREIRNLRNKILRQTLHHQTQLDDHVNREITAKQRLEKSQKEHQDLIHSMKIQVSNLQHKIREMQSEKVNLASHISQQIDTKQPNEDEISQIKQIAERYKSIVTEQDTKLSSLERIIESKTAEIFTLNLQIGDKEKALQEMSENMKEQTRKFAVEQSRKENEANEMLNKTQKFHHREKVLSVAKIQEDLSQSHHEEVFQLKQSLSEEKIRALSRLEESYAQKISKSEESCRRVEKELEAAIKKAEEKDDVIKNSEIKHRQEVHQLNTELQKLQSSLQRVTKESSLNRSQAVVRARQENEDNTLYRVQQAVAESQKSQQAEIQRLKLSLKRVSNELSGVREQNAQLVRREKERSAAQSEFEHELTHQLTDELHQHSIVGITSSQQHSCTSHKKRIGGSLSCLADIANPKKESVDNVLKVLKIANEDLRKRVREMEQKLDAEKKKTKRLEQDQNRVKRGKKDLEQEFHSKQESKEISEKAMKELESDNANLREFIHTLEEERKTAKEEVMSDPRVVEALALLSKLQKRLNVFTEERSHFQEEIQQLHGIIDKHDISFHSKSPISTQVFNEKIQEYSQLQTKYKVLLREKMELERFSIDESL